MICTECGDSPAYETTGDPDDPWPLCALCVQQVLIEAMETDRGLRDAWERLMDQIAGLS